MLQCRFNRHNKMVSAEMMFDVMGFMQQLQVSEGTTRGIGARGCRVRGCRKFHALLCFIPSPSPPLFRPLSAGLGRQP
jgi:hypothetical protein